MKFKNTLKLAASALTVAGASLVAGSSAGAISTGCAGDASTMFPVAGQYVTVTDAPGTYPSACVRVDGVWKTGNRITIVTRLKDSARDNQAAVALVRFRNAAGAWGSWQLAQNPTGQEGSFTAPTTRQFTQQSVPTGIEFAACRSTSWTGFPTNACGFSLQYAL